MEAIKDQMEKLAKMEDGAEKRAQQEQLAQRLNQLSEGLKQAATSPQMQAALQRAMEQLDMSKLSDMSKEALEAAQQSMNLSQQELENLAQAMKDQQALEDALKNLQMAKQLASECKLDGGQCKDCNGQGTMPPYTRS
jgi:DNA repair exonuclease SbcCD ATPase subunit